MSDLSRRLKLAGVAAIALGGVVLVTGYVTRQQAAKDLDSFVQAQAAPTVALAAVTPGAARTLELPGTLEAFASAPIRARTTGYLKRWYVDIGQPVVAGQVLAELETPDLDQQVRQARADLAVAEAGRELAQVSARRWSSLVAQDAVSRQDADEKTGALATQTAAAHAARANLDRLSALQSFKRITAPFAGVVTSRATDVGALVSDGNATGAPLFTVTDQRRLRVYVNLPQTYAGLIANGQAARLRAPEHAGESFEATIVNNAGAVGPGGAVLVELQLDNPGGRLKAGGYVQVSFVLAAPTGAVSVPATALLLGGAGPTIALVDGAGRVELRRVSILRDLGAQVQLSQPLAADARLIDNPAESLASGDLVKVAAPVRPGAAHAER